VAGMKKLVCSRARSAASFFILHLPCLELTFS
jgi:hypothetical protein